MQGICGTLRDLHQPTRRDQNSWCGVQEKREGSVRVLEMCVLIFCRTVCSICVTRNICRLCYKKRGRLPNTSGRDESHRAGKPRYHHRWSDAPMKLMEKPAIMSRVRWLVKIAVSRVQPLSQSQHLNSSGVRINQSQGRAKKELYLLCCSISQAPTTLAIRGKNHSEAYTQLGRA